MVRRFMWKDKVFIKLKTTYEHEKSCVSPFTSLETESSGSLKLVLPTSLSISEVGGAARHFPLFSSQQWFWICCATTCSPNVFEA